MAGGVEAHRRRRRAAAARHSGSAAPCRRNPRRSAAASGRASPRVASTAPWPARAWSEWPWVISARSTGRIGSMWKPPGLQHSPAGVGLRSSSGRMAERYGIEAPLRGPGLTTRIDNDSVAVSSGDLIADRRYRIRPRPRVTRRLVRRRRPVRPGGRGGAGICAGLVRAGRDQGKARRPRRRGGGVARGAAARSARTATAPRFISPGSARPAPKARCRLPMCGPCSISTRRASTAHWWKASPIAARSACSTPSRGPGRSHPPPGSARCSISAAEPGLPARRSGSRCGT